MQSDQPYCKAIKINALKLSGNDKENNKNSQEVMP